MHYCSMDVNKVIAKLFRKIEGCLCVGAGGKERESQSSCRPGVTTVHVYAFNLHKDTNKSTLKALPVCDLHVQQAGSITQ